jgi:hypothetical protein
VGAVLSGPGGASPGLGWAAVGAGCAADFSLAAQSGHASYDGGTSRPHCGQIHVNMQFLSPMLPRCGALALAAACTAASESKRGRVPDPAANAVESAGAEFHCHEGPAREGKLAPPAQQHQAPSDQPCADTPALMNG